MTDTASTRAAESSRVRMLCAVILLALSLAGCVSTPDDASPAPSTPAQSAHSPESTEFIPASSEGPAQNVPEPRLPALVTENSEEGARATLEYFWEASEYARQTGDTVPLSLVSSPDCNFCSTIIRDWDQLYIDGYWVVLQHDLDLKINELYYSTENLDEEITADIFFTLREPNTKIYSTDGLQDATTNSSAETSDWFAFLIFDGISQKWAIDWIGLEELLTLDN